MGCIRSHSRIWASFAVGLSLAAHITLPSAAWAAFASQFSLSVGEQYNDNIFFAKQKDHDFVTIITPTLSLYYAPEGQAVPTLNLNISPSGYIYARHSDLNSFGANSALNGGYTYQYSPRLSFTLSDTFERHDESRTGGLFGGFGVPVLPTTGGGSLSSQNLKNLVSGGTYATNTVSLQGTFQYRPDINFTGGYSNSFVTFIDQGGTEVFQTVGVRGVYNWRQDHNLHAGYWISIENERNGGTSVTHNFDFGDDYFSNYVYTLQLTPTLSLSANTGLSITTGSGGFHVGNSTNVQITKLWERAYLNAGVSKGFTPSFGISGISDTTSLFSNFTLLLTEKLTATANANFSFWDTQDVSFKTFQAGVGLQYWINRWLSAALNYNFNWIDSGAGASKTDLLSQGVVNSNAVFLNLTSYFDIWPNVGLARSMSSSLMKPVLKTPFPTPALPSTGPGPSTGPSTGPGTSTSPTP